MNHYADEYMKLAKAAAQQTAQNPGSTAAIPCGTAALTYGLLAIAAAILQVGHELARR